MKVLWAAADVKSRYAGSRNVYAYGELYGLLIMLSPQVMGDSEAETHYCIHNGHGAALTEFKTASDMALWLSEKGWS